MSRLLPSLFFTGLIIYMLIDCARTDESQVRTLPKWAWILIIIFAPTIGAIAYWIAGRPRNPGSRRPPKRRILPPDDDPDFLSEL